MDPGTGLVILGSAIGGAKVVEKMLGPTADYLGEGLKDWTQRRVENVQRIFAKAQTKLGDRIDHPGVVPPRVLKEILDEGSFCDNELAAEYFGGVLASSRTTSSRDDRGITYLKLIAELSTYQLRFHYLSYYWFRELFKDSTLDRGWIGSLGKMQIFLSAEFLDSVMDLTFGEHPGGIILHCQSGLERHDLLQFGVAGAPEDINKYGKSHGWTKVSEAGFTVRPTRFGIDCWLWAIGMGHVVRFDYLKSSVETHSLLPQISSHLKPQILVPLPSPD